MFFVEIVLENKTRVTDQVYTYKVEGFLEEKIKVGKRVIVPFGKGNKRRLGIIVNIKEQFSLNFKLKNIIEIIDENPVVNEDLIDLAFFMRDKYLSDLSSSFQTILPPGNWKELEEYIVLKDGNELIQDDLKIYLEIPRKLKDLEKNFPTINIKDLKDRGVVVSNYLIKNLIKERKRKIISINKGFKIERVRKNAVSQLKIVEYLLENGKTESSILMSETNTNFSTIKRLVELNIISIEEELFFDNIIENKNKYNKIKLNNDQDKVLNSIIDDKNNFHLIHGITGSGKTEIYLQLTEYILQEGKTAIILVPEISLTPQTIERFSGRFPNKVAVFHSRLTPIEKFEQWQQIKNGDFRIVVGARSAIFAPLENIGLIVIDEEHDNSYVSEMNPKYNAKEIGEKRASDFNAKLVLGSATPDIISYYNAKKGKYKLHELTNRAKSSSLPDISIVDMREELKNGNFSIISEELKQSLEYNLENKKQSILFLNKRGHTSYIFCRRCGYVEFCSHCDVAMTYHKNKNRLICHHCGRTKLKPEICPNCGSRYIKEFGAGTEKLEEECNKLFPNAKIYRIDGDTNNDKYAYVRLYEKMKRKEIDILIGTQMVTKGFDFEEVTLVGIIAADLSLNIGNYKAAENTFQLLTQVSGRAGRGKYKGSVFVQTYLPNHYSIVTSKEHDYNSFYNIEIDYRERFKYPPFYRLININLSGLNRTTARLKLMEVLKYIRKEFIEGKISGIEIIGPNPSPINRINNYYRFDCSLKFNESNDKVLNIIRKILLDNFYNIDFTGFKISISINPITFY